MVMPHRGAARHCVGRIFGSQPKRGHTAPDPSASFSKASSRFFTMSDQPAQPGLAALSKSFEPTAIEAQWGPEWERRGYGRAGARGTGVPDADAAARGGKVLGSVKVPLNTQDFSSFLLQAQSSKAKVIGLANAGGDTINSIKQASEFGITKGGQKLAGLLVFLPDVHGLGLEKAQGLNLTETFYWDLNDQTRAWSKRFAAANGGKYPSSDHAGVYAGLIHYLKAVDAGKTDDGTKTIAKMKEMPTDDILFGKGTIRADGRKLHPAYLFEVKKPSESKGPYDYYKKVSEIPADKAFRPIDQGNCPLVAKK